MPTASSTAPAPPLALELLRRHAPPVAAFVAGVGPVVLLGFSRGGYPVEVVAGYGVALWWLLLVGFLTDAIPRPRPSALGWVALGATVALALWGGLSLSWSADGERGLTEVVRTVVAAGSLLLGMSAARAGQGRVLAGGVLAGLSTIVAAAAITRLFPDLVPSAQQTGDFLSATRLRLAWPLNYWNAIAAAAAMAFPLGVVLAARARNVVASGLAVAPLPIVGLGLAFTLSRGGAAAAVVGLVAAVALVAPRPVLVRTMIAPAIGTGIVLLAGLRSSPLTDVVGGAAQDEAGRKLFLVVVLATLGVGLVQTGLRVADQAHWTPRIPRPGRRTSVAATTAVVVALVVGAIAVGLPGQVSDGWDRFRDPQVTSSLDDQNTTSRFSSVSGNGRYQMWSKALDAVRAHPLDGIGLGSWESWWNPRRGDSGFVRNAHSELFELLAETGVLGGLLFLLVIGTPIASGVLVAVRRRTHDRDAVLVVPALLAFAIALLIDWNWQIGALMVAGMTLAAVPLTRPDSAAREAPPRPRSRIRARAVVSSVGISLLAVGAIVTLSLALIAPQAVDASREAAARGDVRGAVAEAARGESAAGFAATPALQRAFVEEQAGDLAAAERSARRAAERTPEDWRPWFLIARLATARDDDATALSAFRRARRLNPESALLSP